MITLNSDAIRSKFCPPNQTNQTKQLAQQLRAYSYMHYEKASTQVYPKRKKKEYPKVQNAIENSFYF